MHAMVHDAPNDRRRRRLGVTLIEVLVVMGVVGLLTAIVLPAVFAVRAAARRAQCASNLKELSGALQQHHAAHGVFPPAKAPALSRDAPFARNIAPFVFLLPYLDQSQVYDRLNLVHDLADEANPAAATRIAVFRCPADDAILLAGGNCNYRANIGPGLHWNPPAGGAFELSSDVADGHSTADFADGTSHTAMLSERLLGDGAEDRFADDRDYWFTGLDVLLNRLPTLAELEEVCLGYAGASGPHFSESGGRWFWAGFPNTWYNHAATPNATMGDCATNTPGFQSVINGGFITARSRQGGGVHVAMADGSVAFLGDAIDRRLWWALATRSGGEADHDF